MLAQIKRLMIFLPLLAAPLALLALPGVGWSHEEDHCSIRRGVYDGIWHTDPVTIIIDSVDRDGSFKGEMHFDPQGRWGDVRCGIFGRLENNGSLTITREDCSQTARTGRPERSGRTTVWKGEVRAADFTSTFELRIPEGPR